MSLTLAALIVCGCGALLSLVLLLIVALMAAPRGVTKGPLVLIARGLFIIACGLALLAAIALVWGVSTSWA